jgi:hypothetical protein
MLMSAHGCASTPANIIQSKPVHLQAAQPVVLQSRSTTTKSSLLIHLLNQHMQGWQCSTIQCAACAATERAGVCCFVRSRKICANGLAHETARRAAARQHSHPKKRCSCAHNANAAAELSSQMLQTPTIAESSSNKIDCRPSQTKNGSATFIMQPSQVPHLHKGLETMHSGVRKLLPTKWGQAKERQLL